MPGKSIFFLIVFVECFNFFQPKNDDAVCVIPTYDLKHGKKHLKGIKP